MILQRLASAIRHQNGSQIITEILIVVIGIFIGLQVQSWYDGRAERQQEVVYLERLLKDADNSILDQQVTLNDFTKRNLKFQQMLDMLADNLISNDNMSEFSNAYLSTFGWPAIQYYQETMNEMISSGTLSVILSTDFRTKISRFRDRIRFTTDTNTNFGENIQVARQNLNKIVKLDRTRTIVILTPSDLHNNDTIYNLINAHALYQDSIYSVAIEFHEETKAFREEIATELVRLK